MKALNHDRILLISPKAASKRLFARLRGPIENRDEKICACQGVKYWWKVFRWNLRNPDFGVTAFPASFSEKVRGRLGWAFEFEQTQWNSVKGGRFVSRKIRKGYQTDFSRGGGWLIRPNGLSAAFDLRTKLVGQRFTDFLVSLITNKRLSWIQKQ